MRELRACDYGAPTIRKRLFLIARRDGRPIVWPEPSHGDPKMRGPRQGRQAEAGRTAAEIIDWSLPCPSIFLQPKRKPSALGVKRPLADATMARIAKGVKRYVLDAAEPFIIPVTHSGDSRVNGIDEPLRTVTTAHRGEHGLGYAVLRPVNHGAARPRRPRIARRAPLDRMRRIPAATPSIAAHLMTMRNSQKPFNGADEPTHTITSGGAHLHLVAAFLAQHNTDMVGHGRSEPVSTIVQNGCTQAVVEASLLSHAYTSNTRGGSGDLNAPIKTVTAQGGHAAEVRAFLVKYYGEGGTDQSAGEPLHTVPPKARFGLANLQQWTAPVNTNPQFHSLTALIPGTPGAGL